MSDASVAVANLRPLIGGGGKGGKMVLVTPAAEGPSGRGGGNGNATRLLNRLSPPPVQFFTAGTFIAFEVVR